MERSPAPATWNARRRFLVMLVLIYVCSLPAISTMSYYLLRRQAIKSAQEAGDLYLGVLTSVRHYVNDQLRPRLSEELPGRFVIEGMSRSFMVGQIARGSSGNTWGVHYKNAFSGEARNPANEADPFEREIVERFRREPQLAQWKGIRDIGGHANFVLARPGEAFTQSCMKCHGDPADAPQELLARYGARRGFGIATNQLHDAHIVYIPLHAALTEARHSVVFFALMYSVIFALMLMLINRRFLSVYGLVQDYTLETQRINADLTELNREMETMVSERTMSLMALTIADRVRNPAAVIGGTARSTLRRAAGSLSPLSREALELIAAEATRLEEIVRDFSSLLVTHGSAFTLESLDELLRWSLRIVEPDAQRQNVTIHTISEPVRINAQRHLLSAALIHALRDAIAAAGHDGSVTVSLEVHENTVRLTITNAGQGLSDRELDTLFTTVQDDVERPLEPGHGVGLSLVRQIIEEHLGTVDVQSRPGVGTSVHIILPLHWGGTAQKPVSPAPPAH